MFVTIADVQNISCNEELVLKICRTDDAKSLVQRLCEIVTAFYCIQFIACTCQISEGANRKIWRCYKSSKQKKRNSNEKEEILCRTRSRKKKKLCLEWFCHYYTNTKRKTTKTYNPVSLVLKKK